MLLQDPSIEHLVSSLKKDAYVMIENAVSPSSIDLILAELMPDSSARINPNELGSVFYGRNQYFTNVIAHSKVVYDIIISDLVLNLCHAYLGHNFMLVNNRIQTTRARVDMPWHTDNNILKHGKLIGRHSMPGLQFVLYLTDVSNSPFQLIKNSHMWSLQHPNHYLTSQEINKFNHEIVNLIPSPGSLLILNTHVFHRAAPFVDEEYTRSILLFQVDQLSPNFQGHGEKMVVNPEYIDKFSPEILSFLGFGRTRSYQPFPETSLHTLSPMALLNLQVELVNVFPKTLISRFAKKLIPQNILAIFKNWLISTRVNTSKQFRGEKQNPYI